jgi:ribosomal protein S27AE
MGKTGSDRKIERDTSIRECPFCGARALLAEHSHAINRTKYYVFCTSDECADGPIKYSKKEAILAWNKVARLVDLVDLLKDIHYMTTGGCVYCGMGPSRGCKDTCRVGNAIKRHDSPRRLDEYQVEVDSGKDESDD